MKKLAILSTALILLGTGCTSKSVMTIAPAPTNTQPVSTTTETTEPTQETMTAFVARKLIFLYPNKFDSGENDSSPDAPVSSTFSHLLSIPFHNSAKILRVYGSCKKEDITTEPYNYTLAFCPLQMVVYDKTTKTQMPAGKISLISGGNSGGTFVPYAITKDDKSIILEAWMGDPGAGGGSVDYGYSIISIPNSPSNKSFSTSEDFPFLARHEAFFYDSFNKVIYTDDSSLSPRFSQPGPTSNDGKITLKIISEKSQKTILELPDTSFKIKNITSDEKTANILITKYTFSDTCPRQEDAQYCAKQTTSINTIPLP